MNDVFGLVALALDAELVMNYPPHGLLSFFKTILELLPESWRKNDPARGHIPGTGGRISRREGD